MANETYLISYHLNVSGDIMKLMEKSHENKKFLISEENGQVIFRIADYEGSKFFTTNLDEVRAMRDTFHEFVKKYDQFILKTINQETTAPPPQPPPGPQFQQPFSILDLPGANAVRDNQTIFSEEKKDKPKFEFY